MSAGLDTPSMARTMCHEFVTDRLRAPSTAKFPNAYSEHRITKLGPGHYQVASYVDAQNGFGAQVRSSYLCEVTTTDKGDHWHANNVSIMAR